MATQRNNIRVRCTCGRTMSGQEWREHTAILAPSGRLSSPDHRPIILPRLVRGRKR